MLAKRIRPDRQISVINARELSRDEANKVADSTRARTTAFSPSAVQCKRRHTSSKPRNSRSSTTERRWEGQNHDRTETPERGTENGQRRSEGKDKVFAKDKPKKDFRSQDRQQFKVQLILSGHLMSKNSLYKLYKFECFVYISL